jgi:alkylation response protein AidB-like acyl-CoA dehydrogenase
MPSLHFEPCDLPPEAETLRGEVRDFLAETMAGYPVAKRAKSWVGQDRDFSEKLGARGWLGMTWPKKYGGHERSMLERYVVLEEVLAAGAPVGGHWIADRQSGPLLLEFGTEKQRQLICPRIARGELIFAIGMSEPDSGSDLASIRTRAVKVDGGWVVNGTKIWTSEAHLADYMVALFRTDTDPDDRHAGMSQFLVDMTNPGVTARPIRNITGDLSFNEVSFVDAFIPEDMIVGEEGGGWKQVIAELKFERAGPERYLSSFILLTALIREISQNPGERAAVTLGRLVAHLGTLRQMSLSIAGMQNAGKDPALAGSIVKDLGGVYEQDMPKIAHELIGADPMLMNGGDFEKALAYVTQASVSFSLRGGTREILRGIIARGLDLR